ncbi:hypothetical protein L9F63_024400 [Diploptera punctata]|uniref:Methyltransferase-like protein 17, mitochondrial n=1 Tax=Diploptera punctata TaxID=6984 RepID=A0AAD8E8B5_DIPPU|nr:hypothetical protein L9F63_024400 [Diploptera punctata]
MLSTMPRPGIQMEENLLNHLQNNEIKPRKHPGVMKIKTVEVPAAVVDAMKLILKDKPVKTFNREALVLSRYLWGRHPPCEEDALKERAKGIKNQLEERFDIDRSSLSNEDVNKINKWCKQYVSKKLKCTVYNWQPVTYDENKALYYMLGRFTPEYAVIYRIFSELKTREPHFHPQTLFDFGSGIGTVTWAAKSTWGDSIKEYFNVDSSVAMNDLATLLLQHGNPEKELSIKKVYFRQFLPASQTLKYDIVLSAYTLFELPSAQSRLQTLVNLWNRTRGYLVLVEQGTNAGFKLILEARNFILHLSEKKDVHISVPVAHVFSPCPHELSCPRLQEDNTPCNFQVTYMPSSLAGRSDARKEHFCYVVLKKGERQADDKQWPRIVREPLVRRKHTVCRMCTKVGKLQEIVFTASKHGKFPYQCSRSSNWGDLLPMTLVQPSDTVQADNVNTNEEK